MGSGSLHESEVAVSEISTSESNSTPSNAEKIPRYMSFLCSTIEKAFAVKCLFSWRVTSNFNYKRVVKFYGLDGRDVAAAYIFDVLTRQLKQARKEFQINHCGRLSPKRKAQLADQFCEGWTSGAYHAIQELVISEEQESKMCAYAKKLNDEGVCEVKTRKSKEADESSTARIIGYREGKHAKVFHGVNGQSNCPVLLGIED